jgi:hypothetical protein
MAERTSLDTKEVANNGVIDAGSDAATYTISMVTPSTGGCNARASSSLVGSSRMSKGKEALLELGTEKEKKVLVRNMAKTRCFALPGS